jgi:hypothetical protein
MPPQSPGRLLLPAPQEELKDPNVSAAERYLDNGQHGMTVFEPLGGDSSNKYLG